MLKVRLLMGQNYLQLSWAEPVEQRLGEKNMACPYAASEDHGLIDIHHTKPVVCVPKTTTQTQHGKKGLPDVPDSDYCPRYQPRCITRQQDNRPPQPSALPIFVRMPDTQM